MLYESRKITKKYMAFHDSYVPHNHVKIFPLFRYNFIIICYQYLDGWFWWLHQQSQVQFSALCSSCGENKLLLFWVKWTYYYWNKFCIRYLYWELYFLHEIGQFTLLVTTINAAIWMEQSSRFTNRKC